MSNENQQNNAENNEPIFNIEKIYAKNISFESPKVPKIFFSDSQPEIEMKFNVATEQIEDFFYENTITATITAKNQEGTIFLCEISQSGIFRIQNVDANSTDIILNVTCPNILFPYVRESVSDTVTRAGFPPVFLAPINFEAMYQQQLEKTGNA